MTEISDVAESSKVTESSDVAERSEVTEFRAPRQFTARCVAALLVMSVPMLGVLNGCAAAHEDAPDETPAHTEGSDNPTEGSATPESAQAKASTSTAPSESKKPAASSASSTTDAEDGEDGVQAPQIADIRFDILKTLATMSTYKADGTTIFKGLTIDFVGVFHRQPAHAMALEGHVSGTRADGQMNLILDDETIYLKGDRVFWSSLGAGGENGQDENVDDILDHYVTMTPQEADLKNLDPVKLSDQMLSTIDWDSFTEEAEKIQLNGQDVFKYVGADDVVLYIDVDSHALVAVDTRIDGHIIQFSRFNQTALIPQPKEDETVPWSND